MSKLSVFAFEGHEVRFVGTPEKPEWIAQDIADVLQIKNVRQVIAHFEDDEKGVCSVYTLGGNQEMLTVTEPGLYRLIFKSRKASANQFRRWVFHEVLPSIRQSGSYSVQQAELPQAATTPEAETPPEVTPVAQLPSAEFLEAERIRQREECALLSVPGSAPWKQSIATLQMLRGFRRWQG